jgi:hypothetical protein
MYCTLRDEGEMAIEFKHNGRIWRTDTTEEARTLRRELEEADQFAYEVGEDPSVIEEDVWTSDAVVELLKGAGQLQKNFLKFLHEKGEAFNTKVESSEIVKALKIDSEEALAGVLSGLSKHLKKIGRQPSELYLVTIQWTKDGKIRRFQLKHSFRWAATQLGWPDKWI